MSDSTNPAYQKGYRAGRRKTEREVEDTKRRNTYADEWNRIYIALLPVAMQVQDWKIGDKPVHTGDERVDLARRWADRAAGHLK